MKELSTTPKDPTTNNGTKIGNILSLVTEIEDGLFPGVKYETGAEKDMTALEHQAFRLDEIQRRLVAISSELSRI